MPGWNSLIEEMYLEIGFHANSVALKRFMKSRKRTLKALLWCFAQGIVCVLLGHCCIDHGEVSHSFMEFSPWLLCKSMFGGEEK